MTQEEFEKLSFEECKSLNGEQETEAVLEAWRAGYLYLKYQISKMRQTADDAFDFIDKVADICDQELDWMKESS